MSMMDVQTLLNSWGLQQLCTIFKDQEICARALKCLTDDDICELIPKIGPRAIFRAKLREWRRDTNDDLITTNVRKRNFEAAFPEPTVVKMESTTNEDDDEAWLKRINDEKTAQQSIDDEDSLLETLPNSPVSRTEPDGNKDAQIANFLERKLTVTNSEDNLEYNELEDADELNKIVYGEKSYKEKDGLNVHDILANNFDGRKAVTFYKLNKTLDSNHRRRIVNIVICTALEQRFGMHVELFDDVARQIIEIFPNESYETYFMPREGANNPKGALYNKFLNMSRQLRKDGLLAYRNQKRQNQSGSSNKLAHMNVNSTK